MNFLAHIYLSGNNTLLTIGNFVADGVRGNSYLNYPKAMQAGIILHRHIDTYTDKHPLFRKSTKLLHKPYGHYSGVIVDIFFDHFLAKNWNQYSTVPLKDYVQDFYADLNVNLELLPIRFKNLTPFMIADDWLFNYSTIEGIQKVLNGMNKRTKGVSKMNEATKELQLFYSDFETNFIHFFKDLEAYSQQKLEIITNEFNL